MDEAGNSSKTTPGGQCIKCPHGRYTVYSCRTNEDLGIRIRFLKCDKCGFLPRDNKITTPLALSPPRRTSRPNMKRVPGMKRPRG